jgi:hypothetical protein
MLVNKLFPFFVNIPAFNKKKKKIKTYFYNKKAVLTKARTAGRFPFTVSGSLRKTISNLQKIYCAQTGFRFRLNQ